MHEREDFFTKKEKKVLFIMIGISLVCVSISVYYMIKLYL